MDNSKSNIPQLLATVKTIPQGGTGIRSTTAGKIVSLDDIENVKFQHLETLQQQCSQMKPQNMLHPMV